MTTAEAVVQVREVAGKRARDEAIMLDRLVETLRLASFRTFLSATVDTMSSLVPDVLQMAGSDVASALQRLRPGHMWPSITRLEDQYGRTGPAFNRKVRVAGKLVTRPAPMMGDAIIAEGALGDWIEAKVVGGSFEVTLRSDGFELTTADGTGYVKLAARLPDTVIASCSGRPLIDIVSHPLLDRHGFVIDRAANVGGSSSLVFQVGRLGLVMPWRE